MVQCTYAGSSAPSFEGRKKEHTVRPKTKNAKIQTGTDDYWGTLTTSIHPI
jgi:hypothetical protein